MQFKTSELIILDPHITPSVFWKGEEIEIIDLKIKKNKVVILTISSTVIIPEDLENNSNIEIKRRH